MKQDVIISQHLEQDLTGAIERCTPDKLFVLADDTTQATCWHKISAFPVLENAPLIVIPSTDLHKNMDALAMVWKALSDGGATRHSCLINLGGGMITDLGGFAASTFKRGISFINIPTTLLAMVDAAVGGKTGINFNGLKNEVGTFCNARSVLLTTVFLDTLDEKNLRSGYAEMLKHALISNEEMWATTINYALEQPDWQELQRMVGESVAVKEAVVAEDPHERGIRKALNLGHTIGHAFESFAMHHGRPILHGYAVAYGLICELYLSAVQVGFPLDKLRQTCRFIKQYYGRFEVTCDHYDELIEWMMHDKKNLSGQINFTLLGDIGDIRINQTATTEQIKNALDFYREGE